MRKEGGVVEKKLTERQKRFADEYLIDLNATQAAVRAGYSVNTAEQTASRLLTYVKIQDYIQRRMKERQKRTEITQDMIIDELKKIGFADVNIDTMKPSDKIKALGLMARMLGIDRPEAYGETEDLEEIERDVFG